MSASSSHNPVSVALATVAELPRSAQDSPDAERVASRIAAGRAIRAIAGFRGRIEIRRRAHRAPVAQVVADDASRRQVALSLTHRNGHAAAIAAPAGSLVGIDLEVLEAVDPSRERFFLTDRERQSAGWITAAALWSIKEAVWKALQLGPDVAFRELELDIDDGAIRGVRFRGMRWRADVGLSAPWPGYLLATAQLGGGR
jgi:phosphopantetheinyl transferase (holo-ACP synthase)